MPICPVCGNSTGYKTYCDSHYFIVDHCRISAEKARKSAENRLAKVSSDLAEHRTEYDKLLTSYNQLKESGSVPEHLQQMMENIINAGSKIDNAAREMIAAQTEATTRLETQLTAVEKSLEEVSKTTQETAERTENISKNMESAVDVVNDMAKGISDIRAGNSVILNVIDNAVKSLNKRSRIEYDPAKDSDANSEDAMIVMLELHGACKVGDMEKISNLFKQVLDAPAGGTIAERALIDPQNNLHNPVGFMIRRMWYLVKQYGLHVSQPAINEYIEHETDERPEKRPRICY